MGLAFPSPPKEKMKISKNGKENEQKKERFKSCFRSGRVRQTNAQKSRSGQGEEGEDGGGIVSVGGRKWRGERDRTDDVFANQTPIMNLDHATHELRQTQISKCDKSV